jgi:hypothetical protein
MRSAAAPEGPSGAAATARGDMTCEVIEARRALR